MLAELLARKAKALDSPDGTLLENGDESIRLARLYTEVADLSERSSAWTRSSTLYYRARATALLNLDIPEEHIDAARPIVKLVLAQKAGDERVALDNAELGALVSLLLVHVAGS